MSADRNYVIVSKFCVPNDIRGNEERQALRTPKLAVPMPRQSVPSWSLRSLTDSTSNWACFGHRWQPSDPGFCSDTRQLIDR
ncbi:hypothetical protein ACVIWV_009672 [Bradyrhizobium diazoefficiens]